MVLSLSDGASSGVRLVMALGRSEEGSRHREAVVAEVTMGAAAVLVGGEKTVAEGLNLLTVSQTPMNPSQHAAQDQVG
jgi:hypothetical protein